MSAAGAVAQDKPVVVSKFILNAKEIEFDGVAQDGRILNYAISEHVEVSHAASPAPFCDAPLRWYQCKMFQEGIPCYSASVLAAKKAIGYSPKSIHLVYNCSRYQNPLVEDFIYLTMLPASFPYPRSSLGAFVSCQGFLYSGTFYARLLLFARMQTDSMPARTPEFLVTPNTTTSPFTGMRQSNPSRGAYALIGREKSPVANYTSLVPPLLLCS